jgi:HEAT repeat protein
MLRDAAQPATRQAGYIAINLGDADYRRAQPSIVALLSDVDIGVRADVAVAMAGRQDRASAPALLALMKQEDMLEPWRQSNAVQGAIVVDRARLPLAHARGERRAAAAEEAAR